MPFRPDPVQPTASPGRFRPDESPAAAGAEDILSNARMSELAQDPAAPLKGAKPLDVQPGYGQRVSSAVARGNEMAARNPATVPVGWGEALAQTVTGGVSLLPASLDVALHRMGLKDPNNPTGDLATAKDKYTYTPRSDFGQAASEQLGAVMSPVGDAFSAGGKFAGDIARDVTGDQQLGADIEASIPDLIGAALGIKGGKAAAASKRPSPVVKGAEVPEGKAKLADIRKQGIKVTPKEASEITGDKNYFGRALQSIAGESRVTKDMAAKNQPVLNEMARKSVGADSITEKGLRPVKDAGNAVYDEMASLGSVTPDDALRSAIEKARGSASKSTKRNVEIDKFVDGILAEFDGVVDANQVVNRVRELRRDAQNSRKGEGEKRPTIQQEALGEAQRAVADALDDFLETNAGMAGKPELAAKYKENRTRLAKVGTVEGASRAGNINAKQLYDQRAKGAPLSGKLNDIAEANEYAPGSTAPAAGAEALMDAPGRNLSLLELPVAALQGAARHMGVNRFLQSDFYQSMIGGRQGGPHLAEHDTNPNAFPPGTRTAPPAAPTAAPDFAGELGLADDAPYETMPGVRDARPVNEPNLADAVGLQLMEDAQPPGVNPLGGRIMDDGSIDLPPEGLSELGALIDEMLRPQRQNPVQQQQAAVVPGTIEQALGLADPFPDRYMVPGSTRTGVSPDEGYIAYASKDGRRQINDAFVKEESRGKGLGQQNLIKAAEEAQAAGEVLDSDVSLTPAQARAYLRARDKGLIDFDITDQEAWDEALANGTNIKAGGQPVVTNIRPVKKNES